MKLNETPWTRVCSSSEGGYGKRLAIIKVLVETGAYEERIKDPELSPVFSTCGRENGRSSVLNILRKSFHLLKGEEFKNHIFLMRQKKDSLVSWKRCWMQGRISMQSINMETLRS